MAIRIFLRQSLFALKGEHVPATAMILNGTLVEINALGVRLRASAYFDEKGKELTGEGRDLLIPEAKIDHVAFV